MQNNAKSNQCLERRESHIYILCFILILKKKQNIYKTKNYLSPLSCWFFLSNSSGLNSVSWLIVEASYNDWKLQANWMNSKNLRLHIIFNFLAQMDIKRKFLIKFLCNLFSAPLSFRSSWHGCMLFHFHNKQAIRFIGHAFRALISTYY